MGGYGAVEGLNKVSSFQNILSSRGGSIRLKALLALATVVVGCEAFYFFIYIPIRSRPHEYAYALAGSTEMIDTTAEVHLVVGKLNEGDRVEVLKRTRNWARVRRADGTTGWVEAKGLIEALAYEAGQQLFKALASFQPQAGGHTGNIANLRIQPSREAPQIAQLTEKQKVEFFGRRLVDRPVQARVGTETSQGPSAADSPEESKAREAWYLVRTDSKAGWLLGRLVELDVPESISMYAQGMNLVAWLVLNTVNDRGQQVPQYLVADRQNTQEADFTHIRILTWWLKNHRYVTAYVESGLEGYFPIQVGRINNVPYFRLHLRDKQGRKYQKVYELSHTITRPLGIVEGWESDAMPAKPLIRRRAVKRARPVRPARAKRKHRPSRAERGGKHRVFG